MKHEYLMEALGVIAEEQQHTAPVELRIGGNEENKHGELYLNKCCAHIIDALIDQGYSVEATKFDGAHVMYLKPEL